MDAGILVSSVLLGSSSRSWPSPSCASWHLGCWASSWLCVRLLMGIAVLLGVGVVVDGVAGLE